MNEIEERQIVYQPLFDFDVRYVDKFGCEINHRIVGASSPGRALVRFDYAVPAQNRTRIMGVRKVQL